MDNQTNTEPEAIVETCPACGSTEVEHWGFEDGGGMYGLGVTDTWNCWSCSNLFTHEEFDLPE